MRLREVKESLRRNSRGNMAAKKKVGDNCMVFALTGNKILGRQINSWTTTKLMRQRSRAKKADYLITEIGNGCMK